MTAETWATIILIGFLGWGGVIIWRLLAARRDAGDVFTAMAKNNSDVSALGEDGFRAAYMRARGPRPAIYAFIASVVAVVLLPLFYTLSAGLWGVIWRNTGQAPDLAEGLIPWTFFMILMMMACWVGVAAVFARLYHWNRPQSLEQEVKKELDAKA